MGNAYNQGFKGWPLESGTPDADDPERLRVDQMDAYAEQQYDDMDDEERLQMELHAIEQEAARREEFDEHDRIGG